MRFIASREGFTNTLSTTQKFVVIDNDDFSAMLGGLNVASLLIDQVESLTNLDGEPLPKSGPEEAIWAAHEAAGRAKWMQVVIS